jgi:hypothetical protein
LGVAGLVVLLGIFYAEENWRGEHAWEVCRQELVAKGVDLEWAKFIPAPVPDEQNFATTPFLAPLFDFNPRPLGPGETFWRDTAGHDRAVNFGASLLPRDKLGSVPPINLSSQLTDLGVAVSQLRNQTNAPAGTVEPFASRTAAAKALLEALEPLRPVLEELQTASRRPYCRFKIQYDAEDPASILLPHYLVLTRVGKVLQVRASAELALQQTTNAFEDLRLIFFLADSIQSEPFLITLRAGAYLLTTAEQTLWEGLAERQWSEAQLRELETQLNQINFFASLSRGLQSERAGFGNRMFDYLRSHKNALRGWVADDPSAGSLTYLLAGPEGWFYQEQVVLQRTFERRLGPLLSQGGFPHPRAVEETRKALDSDFAGSGLRRHNAMSKLLLDKLLDIFEKAARAETQAQLAATACALELYRQNKGTFPETLESIVPQFAASVPLDVCDGKSLKYRRVASSQFLLYGVGWNEADDGGTIVMNKEGTAPTLDKGDWAWPVYPKN